MDEDEDLVVVYRVSSRDGRAVRVCVGAPSFSQIRQSIFSLPLRRPPLKNCRPEPAVLARSAPAALLACGVAGVKLR